MAYTPNWTYGMVMPSGDNTESDPFDASEVDDGLYLHEVPEAVGDGKDLLGKGAIIAGVIQQMTTTTNEVED